MSLSVNKLNRDIFKDPTIDLEEVLRRLNLVVEQISDLFDQVSGDRIDNPRVVEYGDSQAEGETTTIFGQDGDGNPIQILLHDGIVVPSRGNL